MRKRTFSYYLLAVVLFTGVIALFAFFNAWTFAPHTVENKTGAGPRTDAAYSTHAAYAVSNGWHVGLVVPAGRMNALMPELKKRFDNAKTTSAGVSPSLSPSPSPSRSPAYYEIGWGDRGFYEAKEITKLMAVQAMFNSPGTVMHVVAVHNPAKAFGNYQVGQVIKFCLSEAQLTNLETFIVNSFAKNTTENIISRRPGLYGDSQFYEGAGTYHFLNSCNTWAAKALRSAGFDIKPTFKLFASQVMNNIDVPACQATM